jgi:hypothetical protein
MDDTVISTDNFLYKGERCKLVGLNPEEKNVIETRPHETEYGINHRLTASAGCCRPKVAENPKVAALCD